ncbi:metallophosphoesterase [Streptomyces sp. NPDC004610]|uniref:metallophosphoesterase n=1 Tax=unclassified Streptomyces TaxID=2593676 RepID=UPI0033B22427
MLGIGLYAAMVAGSALFHFYLWVRLVRDTTRPGGHGRRWGTVAIVLSAVVAPATRILMPYLGPENGRWLAWPGYILIGVILYLLTGLALAEIPRAIAVRRIRAAERADQGAVNAMVPVDTMVPAGTGGAVPAGAGTEPPEPPGDTGSTGSTRRVRITRGRPTIRPVGTMDRRLFLGRTVGAVVGTTALATTGYGIRTALGDPVILRVPVQLPRLDPRVSGLRIATISDLHLGPILGRSHTERVVRLINRLEPDLVAIVGDLADGTSAQLGHAISPFRSLESRYGNFFVTGNHEYFYDDVQGWVEELRDLGVRPLLNERVEISHNGGLLDLAGVEDVTGEEHDRGPDFTRTLEGRDADRAVVLLAHQPVLAEQASDHGVDLQLSGHTHGGQMFPLNAIAGLSNPVLAGLGKVGDTQLYVTKGVGSFGPPVRVGAAPDISVIELHGT